MVLETVITYVNKLYDFIQLCGSSSLFLEKKKLELRANIMLILELSTRNNNFVVSKI